VLTYDVRRSDSSTGPILFLSKKPVTFPSNHAGFLGGEYGQRGDPDGFAATLRRVLNSES
jgi:hypothetical protein